MGANCRIAHLFSEIASMLEIRNANPFRIKAYKNAADLIGAMEKDVAGIAADARELARIRGIGKDMSAKIKEFVDTGEIEYHTRLRSELGAGLLEMLKLRGVGPGMVRLFSQSGIADIDELQRRLESGALTGIQGVGKKKADSISEAVAFYKSSLSVRGLGESLASARVLCDEISGLDGVFEVRPVGGIRRMRETVSEIELLVSHGFADSPPDLFFKKVSNLRHVETVGVFDGSKFSLGTTLGIKAVVHTTAARDFAFDLVRLTGSQSHWKKLASLDKNGFETRPQSEEDLYSGLGLPFIPPELREDRGEIEAAQNGSLPELVELSEIKGDLHTHTNWSDGRDSVESMALAARDRGYEYIALTDHSPSSTVANGLISERLARKAAEVKEVNSRTDGIEILMGAEVDIKPDGSLDYPDDVLAGLDFVVASVHSSFSQDSDLMTARVVRALENRFVHVLGHPTARIIGRRAPCRMDMEKITDAALKNGTALEVNSSCHRLDLKDEHVRLAVEKGVKLTVSTDAHSAGQLGSMACGVAVARRGWARKRDFLNTLSFPNLVEWLEGRKRK